jgi:hypothetical protein
VKSTVPITITRQRAAIDRCGVRAAKGRWSTLNFVVVSIAPTLNPDDRDFHMEASRLMNRKTRLHRQMPAAAGGWSRRQALHGLGAGLLAAGVPVAVSGQERRRLHFLIPAASGGGWDQTARAVAESLTRTRLVDTVTFEHLSGE